MVFDTSCWASGPTDFDTSQQLYINFDNPVQRRPKIDFFNASDVAPIVSHISSNGKQKVFFILFKICQQT